jgi:phenylacetate-CoA ligase
MSVRSLVYLFESKRDLHRKLSDLQTAQLRRLRGIVSYAYRSVPFYRRKLDDAGIKPDDIRSLEDVNKIPFTTKAEIQNSSVQDITAAGIDSTKCVRRETTGSTGIPLSVFLDDKAADFEKAIWIRTYLENGVKIGDKMAIMAHPTDFPLGKNVLQYFGMMRREYISVLHNIGRQIELLERFKPDAIKGYSTTLEALSETVAEQKKSNLCPRLVFAGAESLDKESRNRINSAFQTKLLDNYGCSEFGLLAWECQKHMGYHINVDSVLMEMIKDGEPAGHGQRGEVVCTGLHNLAMPLIRYRLDDIGMFSDEKCACGVTLPLMKIIEGRTEDFLITLDGRMIPPSLFFPFPFGKDDGVKQFRIIQDRKDSLKFQLVTKEGFSDEAIERATRRIKNLFGNDIYVEFHVVDVIERGKTGKMRKIISRLTSSEVDIAR